MFNLIKQLLDWIYHRVCYFCHKPCEGLMCQRCYEETELNFPASLRKIDNIEIYSAGLYTDNIKKLIRGLKYHKQKDLSFYAAKMIFTFWQKLDISDENFEIIPVPLHKKRLKQRGYNHTELIANEFSKLTGYSVNTSLVKKIKETKPLYYLKLAERSEVLKNAFEVDLAKYNGKKLLLIDDICTTGSTLREIIRTLKKHNIDNICAVVLSNPG